MGRWIILLYLIIYSMSLIFKPSWVNEGKGAKVIRVIGNQYLRNLDPFLMLDYFKVRLPAGFPDHPHRGFETVTYMQQGSFYHEDFKGHKGKIGPGDLQWMTAGKGILHSEVPASYDEDNLGFQLWINLESKNKMIEPAYQEYTSDKIQVYQGDKVEVKIISGKWEGKTGPIYARTPSYYFDVHILPGGVF
jgi:quercetin 2,3-dioxygenase